MAASEDSLRQQLHTLYSDHHGWLQGWLRKKLGCAHHAADIAHDTFTRILISLDKGTAPEPGSLRQPRAFLTTTATRLLIDNARRREIERAYLQTLAILQVDEASVCSPEHLLDIIETLTAIARLLEGLPEKPRMAFLLYRLDGLPQAEIADRLGVSPSMVKQYIAQAMTYCYVAQYGVENL